MFLLETISSVINLPFSSLAFGNSLWEECGRVWKVLLKALKCCHQSLLGYSDESGKIKKYWEKCRPWKPSSWSSEGTKDSVSTWDGDHSRALLGEESGVMQLCSWEPEWSWIWSWWIFRRHLPRKVFPQRQHTESFCCWDFPTMTALNYEPEWEIPHGSSFLEVFYHRDSDGD